MSGLSNHTILAEMFVSVLGWNLSSEHVIIFITFASISILEETCHHDYQSTYRQKLAKFSTD